MTFFLCYSSKRSLFAFAHLTAESICGMPLPSSHFRQVSMGNPTAGPDVRGESRTDTFGNPSKPVSTPQVQFKRICAWSIHDDLRNDVFVNLDYFRSDNINVGDFMQIKALSGAANTSLDSSGSQLYCQGRSGQSYADKEFNPSTANSRISGQKQKHDHPEFTSDPSERFIFVIKDMPSEQKSKQPGCQVCRVSLIIPRSIF